MNTPSLYHRLGGHAGIAALLHPFYIDVRQHSVLGPVFSVHIQDWESHLGKIAEFWARQTGGPSGYGGGFGVAHLQLGIGPEHFQQWLGLWDFNCQRHLPAAEAQEMSALAHEIGQRLQSIIEGKAGLRIGPG